MLPITLSDAINLADLPIGLANSLGITVFAAGILASAIFIMLFIIPLVILTKGKNFTLLWIVGLLVLGLDVAIGWLPYWFLFVIVLGVVLMLAGQIRDMITGTNR